MLNIIKRIIRIIIFITYIALFILNIINIGYVYILPLIFEIFIIMLCGYRYMKNYSLKFEKIALIKNVVLFITLGLGMLSNIFNINPVVIKIALTLTIVLEVLVFLKINSVKMYKKKRV